LLVENPVKRIKRTSEDGGRERWLRAEEREALLASVQHPDAPDWLYPLIVMALGTGARRGELFGLAWADVELDRGVAYLSRTKNDKPRVLSLLAPVVAVLRDWKARAKIRRIGKDHVFSAGYYTLDKPWHEALARAEIENFRFHDLRHSCASYLAQAGVPQRTIMEAMGHKSLAASQRYMHLDTEHVTAALGASMAGKL
jgi:integrase